MGDFLKDSFYFYVSVLDFDNIATEQVTQTEKQ